MKFLLIFVFSIFVTFCGYAQKTVGTVNFDNDIYASSTERIKRVDDEHFIILRSNRGRGNEIIKYNKKMEEIFTLTFKEEFPSFFEVDEDSKELIVIQNFEVKGSYGVKAFLYNAEDGQLINSKTLAENLDDVCVIHSNPDKRYFYLLNVPEKKYKSPYEITTFSVEGFEQMGNFSYQLEKKEEVFFVEMVAGGNIVLGVKAGEEVLKYSFYNVLGELKKKEEVELELPGKQYYFNYVFSEQSKETGAFVFGREVNNILEGIDVWRVKYQDGSFKKQFGINADKEFLKSKLYTTVFPEVKAKPSSEYVVSTKKSGPGKLKDYSLRNALFSENGNLIFVLDQFSYKNDVDRMMERYRAENIIFTAFDWQGKHQWSSVVERKSEVFSSSLASHPFKPRWTGLDAAVFNISNEEIGVVSWENKIAVARRINTSTGSFTMAAPIFIKMAHLNVNYVNWLNYNSIVLVHMGGSYMAIPEPENTHLSAVEIE